MPNLVELFEATIAPGPLPAGPEPAQLIALAQSMHAAGFTPSYGPGDHGNLSCRTRDGILITARATSKASLTSHDLVVIRRADNAGGRPTLRCLGARLPSTDAWMHWQLYADHSTIHAIIHGHDAAVLRHAEALGLQATRTSGLVNSPELIEEVRQLAQHDRYFLTRDHGFLALGTSVDDATTLLWSWHQRASARDAHPNASPTRRPGSQ